MKVLLINGSPHEHGCTDTALCKISEKLNEHGVETEFFVSRLTADGRLHPAGAVGQVRRLTGSINILPSAT